ncbi:hypothetical protein NDU88_003401 [Pleurodeles waltl]|uniref:Uncharacterized protein n=1 Tax=Pleurodeles waltl TaxID=8319 RepID=A0AAV7MQM1_PLEWA|nr:hypothetical protein NDU88_003401 [Pleurodeles waltl]
MVKLQLDSDGANRAVEHRPAPKSTVVAHKMGKKEGMTEEDCTATVRWKRADGDGEPKTREKKLELWVKRDVKGHHQDRKTKWGTTERSRVPALSLKGVGQSP